MADEGVSECCGQRRLEDGRISGSLEGGREARRESAVWEEQQSQGRQAGPSSSQRHPDQPGTSKGLPLLPSGRPLVQDTAVSIFRCSDCSVFFLKSSCQDPKYFFPLELPV